MRLKLETRLILSKAKKQTLELHGKIYSILYYKNDQSTFDTDRIASFIWLQNFLLDSF